MATSKKTPAEVKEPVVTAAAEEVKNEAPADEAVKAEEKKPAAKKPAAKKTAEKKPAAKKPAAKKTAEKKTAAKKPASKKTAKKISYDDVVIKAKEKITSKNVANVKLPIAVNIELYGTVEGIFYINIHDKKIDVEPYKYDDYDVNVRIDTDEFVKLLDGKLKLADILAGDVQITGMTKKALIFVTTLF